jgi:hypothetical protein
MAPRKLRFTKKKKKGASLSPARLAYSDKKKSDQKKSQSCRKSHTTIKSSNSTSRRHQRAPKPLRGVCFDDFTIIRPLGNGAYGTVSGFYFSFLYLF